MRMKVLLLAFASCLVAFSFSLNAYLVMAQSRSLAKLEIKVSLEDKELSKTVIPDFPLLILKKESDVSDLIVSSLRVKTGADCSVTVSLLPGDYTIKSENPLLVGTNAYEWQTNFKVQLGASNLIELSSKNVTITPGHVALREGRITREADLLALLRGGVVSVQGEFGQGTGFIADSTGLIITTQHLVSKSKELRIQFDRGHKVKADLLVEDAERDLAILLANLAACPACNALVLATTDPETEFSAGTGKQVFAINRQVSGEATLKETTVMRAAEKTTLIDMPIEIGDSGAPFFNNKGGVIGVVRFVDQRTKIHAAKDTDALGRDIIEPSGVIAIEKARDLLAKAVQLAKEHAAPPSGELLPTEPDDSFPTDALKDRIDVKTFKPNSYQMEVGKYQLTMITPALKYYVLEKDRVEFEQRREKEAKKNKILSTGQAPPAAHSFRNFANWAEYVSQMKPVIHLLAIPEVKATAKSVFWNILRAGAIAALVPPDYKFKVNFQEMFLTCDGKPVIPIHRGRIDFVSDLQSYHRVKSRHAYAGLYTYEIESFDPQRCKQLSLKITSEESSVTPDNKHIAQELVRQVWKDFEPYRQKRVPGSTP